MIKVEFINEIEVFYSKVVLIHEIVVIKVELLNEIEVFYYKVELIHEIEVIKVAEFIHKIKV